MSDSYSSSSSAGIVRATAKYRDVGAEVPRQRPIIRINDATASAHYIEAADLARSVRASLDQGRDNPFRPDGEMYRSVEPIVNYYKLGANQSRTQTPEQLTELLLGGGGIVSPTPLENGVGAGTKKSLLLTRGEGAGSSSSCWRKWLCCGLCCRRRGQRRVATRRVQQVTINDEQRDEDEQLASRRRRQNLELGARGLTNGVKPLQAPTPPYKLKEQQQQQQAAQKVSILTSSKLRLGNGDAATAAPPPPPTIIQSRPFTATPSSLGVDEELVTPTPSLNIEFAPEPYRHQEDR